MNQADLLKLSNYEIESRAIEGVIAFERAAGRRAKDTRKTQDAPWSTSSPSTTPPRRSA